MGEITQQGDSQVKESMRLGLLKELVIIDVMVERERQNQLWGIQRHQMGDWLKILIEEVGEVAQAMQKDDVSYKDSDASDLYKELIQVSAVAQAIAEQVRESRDREMSHYK